MHKPIKTIYILPIYTFIYTYTSLNNQYYHRKINKQNLSFFFFFYLLT